MSKKATNWNAKTSPYEDLCRGTFLIYRHFTLFRARPSVRINLTPAKKYLPIKTHHVELLFPDEGHFRPQEPMYTITNVRFRCCGSVPRWRPQVVEYETCSHKGEPVGRYHPFTYAGYAGVEWHARVSGWLVGCRRLIYLRNNYHVIALGTGCPFARSFLHASARIKSPVEHNRVAG